jgi:hypothetical protein
VINLKKYNCFEFIHKTKKEPKLMIEYFLHLFFFSNKHNRKKTESFNNNLKYDYKLERSMIVHKTDNIKNGYVMF